MQRLGHVYSWLYYRCYRYGMAADGPDPFRWATASLYVTLLLLVNVSAVLFLVILALPREQANAVPLGPKWLWFWGIVCIEGLHMLLLWSGGRYKRILGRFSHETPEQQRRGDRLFGWYLVTSVFSLFGIWMLVAFKAGAS